MTPSAQALLLSRQRFSSSRRRGSRGTKAFSLIELIIVLVLISIMTALIVPEMKGTFEDALLRSTSRKLVSSLNLAYSQAVSLNQKHRVRFDMQSSRYRIERASPENDTGHSYVPATTIPGAEADWDPRIILKVVPGTLSVSPEETDDGVPAWDEVTQSDEPLDSITFYPDGTADRVEIQLRDRAGFGVALQINPVTSRVSVSPLVPNPLQ